MAQTKMKKKGANTSLVFTNKMYFFLIPALAFFLIFFYFYRDFIRITFFYI